MLTTEYLQKAASIVTVPKSYNIMHKAFLPIKSVVFLTVTKIDKKTPP